MYLSVRRPDADSDGHLPSVPRADVSRAERTQRRLHSLHADSCTFRLPPCRLPSQKPFMVLRIWGRSRSRMQGLMARVEASRCTVLDLDSSERRMA